MSDPKLLIVLALIAAVPPTLAAAVAIFVSLHNKDQIQNIHLQMNSRFDEWMKMAKEASFAAGMKAEQQRSPENPVKK